MKEKSKMTTLSNGILWLGAAISVAEIMTGAMLAPIGFKKGVIAIVIGHAIGFLLMLLSGLIGAKSGKNSMESVKMTFGKRGGTAFALMNIAQLIGWSSIMIASGAKAANRLFPSVGVWIWTIAIGALIVLWTIKGLKDISALNALAMILLFAVTVGLSVQIFSHDGNEISQLGSIMSFSMGIELAVAMPVSWLPLISDYTHSSRKPMQATVVSCAVYFAGSCWMYIIGLGSAIFVGTSDIVDIMIRGGFVYAGLTVIVLSTVTTTFLDVYSAAASTKSVYDKVDSSITAASVCVSAVILANLSFMEEMESFLYLISSVFVPMICVQIVDFFCFGNGKEKSGYVNMFLWAIGFAIYRLFLHSAKMPMGITATSMIIIIALSYVVNKFVEKSKNK